MKGDSDLPFLKALYLVEEFSDCFPELASLLRKVQEQDPKAFKELISNPLLGRRKGYYLVEIDKVFGGDENLRPRLKKIGWTRLEIIARHVTPDNRDDLLGLAETHTAKNLEAIMRGEDPIIGGRSVLLLFTQPQFAAFSKAILAHGAIPNGEGFIGKEAALIAALDMSLAK